MLVSEATKGKLGGSFVEEENPVEFKDRRALLGDLVRLLNEKNKHPTEDDESEFEKIKGGLYDGGESGSGANSSFSEPDDE